MNLVDPVKKAEFDRHNRQHIIMFKDGPDEIECVCGWTVSYEHAEEYGFDSWERGKLAEAAKMMMRAEW